MAFEAKSTEPLYETVEEWLKDKRASDNAQRVLRHWLTRIDPSGDLQPEAVMECVNQMVHRTASACAQRRGGRRLHVVHQLFRLKGEDHLQEYREALKTLANAVAGYEPALSIWLSCMDTEPTLRFEETDQLIRRSEEELQADLIRQAVIEGRLFSFAPAVVERIWPSSSDGSAAKP